MHELAITQSILDISLSEAEKYGAKKINSIKIALGVMGGMVPECIQEYFNLISDGTIASGAELKFRKIPAAFKCADCGEEFSSEKISFRCTSCGSNRVKMTSGREFYIESIDIDE